MPGLTEKRLNYKRWFMKTQTRRFRIRNSSAIVRVCVWLLEYEFLLAGQVIQYILGRALFSNLEVNMNASRTPSGTHNGD